MILNKKLPDPVPPGSWFEKKMRSVICGFRVSLVLTHVNNIHMFLITIVGKCSMNFKNKLSIVEIKTSQISILIIGISLELIWWFQIKNLSVGLN